MQFFQAWSYFNCCLVWNWNQHTTLAGNNCNNPTIISMLLTSVWKIWFVRKHGSNILEIYALVPCMEIILEQTKITTEELGDGGGNWKGLIPFPVSICHWCRSFFPSADIQEPRSLLKEEQNWGHAAESNRNIVPLGALIDFPPSICKSIPVWHRGGGGVGARDTIWDKKTTIYHALSSSS